MAGYDKEGLDVTPGSGDYTDAQHDRVTNPGKSVYNYEARTPDPYGHHEARNAAVNRHVYDPAASHGMAEYGPTWGCDCPSCVGRGPGGRTTNIQNNEKAILEYNNCAVIWKHAADGPLCSDHDAYSQGVYKTHDFNSDYPGYSD